MTMQLEYFTIREAAERLGKDQSQVWRYIDQKLLPAVRLGYQWVIERSAVESFTPPPRGNPNFRKS